MKFPLKYKFLIKWPNFRDGKLKSSQNFIQLSATYAQYVQKILEFFND